MHPIDLLNQTIDYTSTLHLLLFFRLLLPLRETLLSLKLEQPFVYRFEHKLDKIGIHSKAENIDDLAEDIWASR